MAYTFGPGGNFGNTQASGFGDPSWRSKAYSPTSSPLAALPITQQLPMGQSAGAPSMVNSSQRSMTSARDSGNQLLDTLEAGESAQQSQSNSNSSTFFSNPGLAQALAQLLGNVAQQTGSQYADFLANPTASPLFQNSLSGLMEALAPSENAARLNLNDQFRAAGNTASSTFGHNAMGLESELLRNRQSMASNLLSTMFPQMAQALYQPMSQLPSLMDALKLNQSTSTSTSSGGSKAAKNTGSMGTGGGSGYYYSGSGMAAARGGPGELLRSGRSGIEG